MQSEQPHGLTWWLRANPRLWATVIPIVALVLAALVTSQLLLPVLPKNLRKAFESADQQANSKQLHVAERLAVKAELRRLAAAAQEKSIDYEECEAAIRDFHLVMMEMAISRGLAQSYIVESPLSTEEQVAAVNTLCRYASAMCQGKVPEETAVEMDNRTSTVDERGVRRFREELPEDELRELLSAMEAVADEAGMPESVAPIDVTARVRQIVDEALAQP